MEEKLKADIVIPKDVLVNKELSLIQEEQHHKKKDKVAIDEASDPLFSGSRWRERWPTLKPFVNGGAIGVLAGSWACLYYANSGTFAYVRSSLPQVYYLTKIFPGAIYIHVLTSSVQLGLFETIRKKAIATNEGMPPSLYQEAACGLAVGAAGACMNFPLYFAYSEKQWISCLPADQRPTFKTALEVVFSKNTKNYVRDMWRVANPHVRRKMWFDMGLLASYNPSLDYFRESCGFSEARAQLGAGATSAFFAALCSLPSRHIRVARRESGYATSLDAALAILKSRGPFGFFTGLPLCFLRTAPPVMTTWFVLEKIRQLELSIELWQSER